MRKISQDAGKPTFRPLSETQRIRQLIQEKQLSVDELNTIAITLRTQIEGQILENFTVESKYLSYERQLQDLKDETSRLESYELSSMDQLRKKINVESHEMMLGHQQHLNARKEEISAQVDEMFAEKQKRYDDEIEKLKREISLEKTRGDELDACLERRLHSFEQQQAKTSEESSRSLRDEMCKQEEEMGKLTQSITSLVENCAFIHERELPSLHQDLRRYNSILHQLTAKNSDKQLELSNHEEQIRQSRKQIAELEAESRNRNEEVTRMQFEIKRMKTEVIGQESTRRILHSQLQELKGNIRVFCRVRAVDSGSDLINIELSDDDLNEEGKQELTIKRNEHLGVSNTNSLFKFQFDKIFSMHQGNHYIFDEYSQLIQSCMDGSNVCVFAYGQTGSGKTFTMSNLSDGMIPLSIKKIFDDIEELRQQGQWAYEVTGKFVEIYNENIIDLLNPRTNIKHEIKHDDINCKTSITDVTSIVITSPEQANQILERVNNRRTTAATKSNDKSSRSHSIFIMDVVGRNEATGAATFGTLNLVDLAGSERINVSQVEGERLRETQAINKSLSSLGDVISSLNSTSASHIPYRNSKLTYLLKHSLGGNSKTLMFVNVSPLSANFNETINSLRFATKVNSTKLSHQ
ncbi:uncharacterized protein LODBEIA_P37670 [Lodderomyces beijingensis]|uniref:Kinesin-like protein n=1 Tax=Lodderomyces beijingensis TaxID=1775926 RepID=A0ABP0ZPE1_9ASCO